MTSKTLLTLAAALALAVGTMSPALAEDAPADDSATTTEGTAAPTDEAPEDASEAPQE